MKKDIRILLYLFVFFFCVLAISNITHPLLFILYVIFAAVFHPKLYPRIFLKSKKGNAVSALMLMGIGAFIFSLLLVLHYDAEDAKSVKDNLFKTVQIGKWKQQRHDSLIRYFNLAVNAKKIRPDSALLYLENSHSYRNDKEDSQLIRGLENQIYNLKADKLINTRKYKKVKVLLDSLIDDDNTNPEFLYKRAICQQRTGSLKDAVADLKSAMDIGSEKAKVLFDKLNPVRRIIVGYETLCCDGTTSSARGRGACSHHGGVCNWNNPVYEERRKYE